MNTVHRCPLCQGEGFPRHDATDENRRISSQRFSYLACQECATLFLACPPNDLARYYDGEYYAIPAVEKLASVARKDPNKINLVRRFKAGGRLVEIGPAFGVFAWQAKEAGFQVEAVEMDPACCDYLNGPLGIPTTRSTQPEAALRDMQTHDVIALWHVLEHLPAPSAFLEAAAANLASGGVLVIAMPNPESFQFWLMGRHWPHLDAPRHLTLIPLSALVSKAHTLGLDLLHVTSDDSDARSWNRFGWQRLLMNRFRSKNLQRAMFVLGSLLALLLAPLDTGKFRGSAYTAVFRKSDTQ